MEYISSAEIADLMLRQARFMAVTEVTRLAARQYPELLVTRERVTNIIRHFVRSRFALCEQEDGVYPHRYRLDCLQGYQFKVRGRTPEYDALVVNTTSRAIRMQAEHERQGLVGMANNILNRAVRRRNDAE